MNFVPPSNSILKLPITDRYIWKFREIFLKDFDHNRLQSFINQKRQHLLPALNSDASEVQTENLLHFLPLPTRMKDLQLASERILNALRNKEKITIFGDYDVDGITSCAMLYEFFFEIGYEVDIYIPDRSVEGYGLNPVGLKKCADLGTQLIITVDNGISSLSACELAKDLGIDVIITDHHDLPSQLPQAFAILNPKQQDCHFEFRMLAGVGVAFYLMIGIRGLFKKQNPNLHINLKYFLDYVAIGTIADMAPLRGVNHILCKIGLEVLNQNLRTKKRIGLYELLKLSGWDGITKVDEYDIGFKIGPRLNASGRLGNALHSVSLLKTKDLTEASQVAEFLDTENFNRRELQKQITEEALTMAKHAIEQQSHAIVLHKDDWHPGVVGLVASRILEKYYKPTIILGSTHDKLKGSGRSTHALNLFQVLNNVRQEFISFGGHYHAVGVTLEKVKLSWFQDYLNTQAKKHIPVSENKPILFIDGILPLFELKFEIIKYFDVLEPFGQDNARLRWLTGPVQIRNIYRFGKDLSQGHAKISMVDESDSCSMTVFNDATLFEQFLETGTDLYIVVELKKKVWKDKTYLDIIVADFVPVVYLNCEKSQSTVF